MRTVSDKAMRRETAKAAAIKYLRQRGIEIEQKNIGWLAKTIDELVGSRLDMRRLRNKPPEFRILSGLLVLVEREKGITDLDADVRRQFSRRGDRVQQWR